MMIGFAASEASSVYSWITLVAFDPVLALEELSGAPVETNLVP